MYDSIPRRRSSLVPTQRSVLISILISHCYSPPPPVVRLSPSYWPCVRILLFFWGYANPPRGCFNFCLQQKSGVYPLWNPLLGQMLSELRWNSCIVQDNNETGLKRRSFKILLSTAYRYVLLLSSLNLFINFSCNLYGFDSQYDAVYTFCLP